MMGVTARVLVGDVRERLAGVEAGSVQTCVTSPPYWGLRDYGTSLWVGGDVDCEHIRDSSKTKAFGNPEFNKNRPSREATKTKGYYFETLCDTCGATRQDSQIGLEGSPDDFVEALCLVFDEVWRVLADDGTLWLNLGDSYAAQRGGSYQPAETLAGGTSGVAQDGSKTNRGRGEGYSLARNASAIGLKHKDLVGIPWRVAFALQARGWYLRSEIIWAKPNPMPESVTDRPTKSHEHIFLLSKSATYFYDHEAIKEPVTTASAGKNIRFGGIKYGDSDDPKHATKSGNIYKASETRNKRDVWTVPTKGYDGAHFAVYPTALIEPCILSGSREGDTVLDPFSGSGTTGVVALRNGRNYLGCELNPDYAELSRKRISEDCGMFGEVIVDE
jgi:DNA modification methylase